MLSKQQFSMSHEVENLHTNLMMCWCHNKGCVITRGDRDLCLAKRTDTLFL